MQTIIGIGQAGCNIAEYLGQYPVYEVYKLDALSLNEERPNLVSLTLQETSEGYEKHFNPAEIESLMNNVAPETLLITSCGNVSGCVLRVLEAIKDRTKISVMYICPQKSDLSSETRLQNNLLFNVMQEYARSAVFEKVMLIDNEKLSATVGPVPILKYWGAMNNMVASTYHMINVFDHSRPVFTTFSNIIKTARIVSHGIVPWGNKVEEKWFFPLDKAREKRYYYAVPRKMLEEDDTLMLAIQKQIKSSVEHDKMKVGYAIYPTNYEQPYIYCEAYSTLIQANPAF